MHQKSPDTPYWVDSTKNYSIFFLQRTFLQQLCTLPCGETTCSTPLPRLIWVCLQQPSWILNMHLQRSQTRYPSVVSSLLGIGRSCREKGLVNMLGAVAAAPCSHWENQLSLLLCVHWRYHDEEKGHGVLCLGGALTKLWRPSGDSDAHNSPQWLSVCPQEKWWWHSPLFRRSWFSDHINRFKFRQMSALLRSILNGLPWSFTTWTCSTQP